MAGMEDKCIARAGIRQNPSCISCSSCRRFVAMPPHSPLRVALLRAEVFLAYRIAGAAIVQQAQLVIAEQGPAGIFARESNDARAIRPAVDQIARQDQPVVFCQRKFLEQELELGCAPMNITDGNHSPFWAANRRLRDAGEGYGSPPKCNIWTFAPGLLIRCY